VPAAPSRQPVRLQPVLDIDGQRYSLNAPSIVLGRSSEADIHVEDTGVSRRHLEIRTANGVTSAVDMGSTNGSYVNGHKVSGSTELTDGSTITMGRTKIIFRLLPAGPGGSA
jgi:pSer/pThr/pTyr-binding forkhead associated (FHA) protein